MIVAECGYPFLQELRRKRGRDLVVFRSPTPQVGERPEDKVPTVAADAGGEVVIESLPGSGQPIPALPGRTRHAREELPLREMALKPPEPVADLPADLQRIPFPEKIRFQRAGSLEEIADPQLLPAGFSERARQVAESPASLNLSSRSQPMGGVLLQTTR
jgi:hypothetical protein